MQITCAESKVGIPVARGGREEQELPPKLVDEWRGEERPECVSDGGDAIDDWMVGEVMPTWSKTSLR